MVTVVTRAAQATYHQHGWFLDIDERELRNGLIRFPPSKTTPDLYDRLRALHEPTRAGTVALYLAGATPEAIRSTTIDDLAQWHHNPDHTVAGVNVPAEAAPYLRATLLSRAFESATADGPAFPGHRPSSTPRHPPSSHRPRPQHRRGHPERNPQRRLAPRPHQHRETGTPHMTTQAIDQQRLIDLRLSRGLAVRQLARDCGIEIAVLNRLETSDNPTLSTLTVAALIRLADRLQVPVGHLFTSNTAIAPSTQTTTRRPTGRHGPPRRTPHRTRQGHPSRGTRRRPRLVPHPSPPGRRHTRSPPSRPQA